MALRIPKREQPSRLTIGDAFARLIEQTIKPESGIDLAAAVHFAAVRICMRHTLTDAESRKALPTLDFLDADPLDISAAIEDGIKAKTLSVEGLPEDIMAEWKASPFVNDWSKGWVLVDEDGVTVPYQPTLNQIEVDALFGLGVEGDSVSGSTEKVGPVALAALEGFVRTTMAASRLAQPTIRERAEAHFAPKRITEALWRSVWRDEPNKLRQGEKPPEKSDDKYDA